MKERSLERDCVSPEVDDDEGEERSDGYKEEGLLVNRGDKIRILLPVTGKYNFDESEMILMQIEGEKLRERKLEATVIHSQFAPVRKKNPFCP